MAKQLPRCDLLKSQPLTQAAASHRQNRADDDNVYLIRLPKEANTTTCAQTLWEVQSLRREAVLSLPEQDSKWKGGAEQGEELALPLGEGTRGQKSNGPSTTVVSTGRDHLVHCCIPQA